MDSINAFLMDYGYWGMFISAFLSGSVFPLSSEAIIVGLLAAGLKPLPLLIYATTGNVLGSVFNYFIGSLGRLEWIEKYMHVKHESLMKAERFMAGHGAWMGFFAFLPAIGEAITIVLGYTRANKFITFLSITLGKLLRYIILLAGMGLIID